MKLGGYQIIDLSVVVYQGEDEPFTLPLHFGYNDIIKILESGNKTVLVTGMPTPDNSAIARDFFAEVSYKDTESSTEIHLTSNKWNISITNGNELYIEELTIPTASFNDESEDESAPEFNFFVSGHTITFAVAEGNLNITVDGNEFIVEPTEE